MPWLPIYDIVIALLVIIPFGLIFFSSVFLYNRLCDKDLLAHNGYGECIPLKGLWNYLFAFVLSFVYSVIFYVLILNDNFDYSLLFFIPPFAVAVLCELKNGFTPMISVVLCGICVVCRFVYYCIFHGLSYGLSVLLSFIFAALVILFPKFLLGKKLKDELDVLFTVEVALMASYFSIVYSVAFIGIIYGVVALGYELPNYVSKKRNGNPVFLFKPPMLFISSFVFAIVLFI